MPRHWHTQAPIFVKRGRTTLRRPSPMTIQPEASNPAPRLNSEGRVRLSVSPGGVVDGVGGILLSSLRTHSRGRGDAMHRIDTDMDTRLPIPIFSPGFFLRMYHWMDRQGVELKRFEY